MRERKQGLPWEKVAKVTVEPGIENSKTSGFDRAFKLNVLIVLICVFLTFKKEAGAEDKPYFTDIGQFNYAKFLLNERDYAGAAREFARLIEFFPASPLIPEAQFRLSEAYFNAGLYNDALAEYKLFLTNFTDSPFAFEAEHKIQEAKSKIKEKQLPLIPAPELIHERKTGMRAVQVMFFEGRSYGEIEKELRRLKDSGVDTVIVRVFHNPGDRFYPLAAHRNTRGVYFRTSRAPLVDDILAPLTVIAHKNGLKIFAWMTTRYADYGEEDRAGLACSGYDLAARKFFRCKGLDIFSEAAVKRLEAIYSDLAGYDIDGILFQDDLVLRHNEGFGPNMEALFKRDTGITLDPESLYLRSPGEAVHYTQLFWRWASWKNKRILDVAGRLKEVVKKKRPDAKFAINLMYESVTNPPYALAWLSQNLEQAVKAGFDYYSIMAYHRQMEDELNRSPEAVKELIGRMVADAARTVGDPQRVLIKLQTVDWRNGQSLSNIEVVELIRDIKGITDVSLAVVPYRGDFPFRELGGKNEVASLN